MDARRETRFEGSSGDRFGITVGVGRLFVLSNVHSYCVLFNYDLVAIVGERHRGVPGSTEQIIEALRVDEV